MKNKKAAMEMSVGTIVTIVLLMSVLVLGIFLVQKIFSSSTGAIDQVDTELQNQINELFTKEGKGLVIMPASRDIKIKKGSNPVGFAFSVLNKGTEGAEYTFEIYADDISTCGTQMTKEKADKFLLPSSGTFALRAGNSLDPARLVKFNVPEVAPPCTIIYVLKISKDGKISDSADIFMTIK
ncbi:MAG: hypothetical protein U9Q99_01415 [Nanoarchaeota archaeon]|nr:hypothetical protein [Nanoarchaeota archaeon]